MRLRPLGAEDALAAARFLEEPELLKQIVWVPPRNVGELARQFEPAIEPHTDGDSFRFAVTDGEAGDFIGSISLRFVGHPGTGELGYWLGKPFWRGGRMTEAVGLISYFAFQVLKAQSLCAWVLEGNMGSRVVLERNGFTLVQTLAARSPGHAAVPRREWYLALLRSEWQRIPDRVQPLSVQVQREP